MEEQESNLQEPDPGGQNHLDSVILLSDLLIKLKKENYLEKKKSESGTKLEKRDVVDGWIKVQCGRSSLPQDGGASLQPHFLKKIKRPSISGWEGLSYCPFYSKLCYDQFGGRLKANNNHPLFSRRRSAAFWGDLSCAGGAAVFVDLSSNILGTVTHCSVLLLNRHEADLIGHMSLRHTQVICVSYAILMLVNILTGEACLPIYIIHTVLGRIASKMEVTQLY